MVAVDERLLNTTGTTNTTVVDRADYSCARRKSLWSLCRCVETPSSPSTAPAASTADLLVSLTNYNPAGYVYETTDANGNVAANFYDSLGRVVQTVASYGTASGDLNQTTLYTYDGLGDQTSMTAADPSTGNQTTTYIYGVGPTTGSEITSNDLLYQTLYPSNGQADTASQAYNALGQVISMTDRDGNVHSYSYDNLGRQISDTVTTLGAHVDGGIRRIDTAYNNQGLAYLLTSYADTAGATIVNQVENIYNGLGQLTQQYQAVMGAVDTSTTPSVQYSYSDPSNGSLLTSMVYPNGRTIDYSYGSGMSNANAALDAAIGRLDGIIDGANSGDVGQVLEQYSYLGLSTIVARNHPQTSVSSVPQTIQIFAGRKDFSGGFHQHFRGGRACGHQTGDDFPPSVGQHITMRFGDFSN